MYTLAIFGMPGGSEIFILLFLVLIFFGKRLPSTMFSIGKSITEFKKGVNEGVPSDEADNIEDKNSSSKE